MTRQPFRIESPATSSDALPEAPPNPNVLELNRIYRCSKSKLFEYFSHEEKLCSWMAQRVEGSIEPGGEACLIWNENTRVDVRVDEMVSDTRIVLHMIDSATVNTKVVLSFRRHDRYSFLNLSHHFPLQHIDEGRMLDLKRKWTFFLDNLGSVCEFNFDQRALKAEEINWQWLRS